MINLTQRAPHCDNCYSPENTVENKEMVCRKQQFDDRTIWSEMMAGDIPLLHRATESVGRCPR